MKANLDIRSNLMIDDERHEPKLKYLPGDFVARVYPKIVDRRVIEKELTRKQIIEYEQYLPCLICKKPCAGTCIAFKSSHELKKVAGSNLQNSIKHKEVSSIKKLAQSIKSEDDKMGRYGDRLD